MGPFAGCS